MVAVSLSWSVVYGSQTVGGASSVILGGTPKLTQNYERFSVSFSAIVTATTASAFNTACAALELAYQTPRQNLTVTIRSSAISLSHSANTGFNATPTIEVVEGSIYNTGLSREYLCSVAVDRPADLTGDSGLLVGSLSVTALPTGQRVVSISGTYTAQPGQSPVAARAQFAAQIGDYTENVLESVDSSLDEDDWDEQPEESETDWQDKFCRFSRVYVERIFPDSNSEEREDSLRNVSQTVVVLEAVGVGVPGAGTLQPRIVQVVYAASVVKAVQPDLKDAWDTIIRPRILRLARLATGDVDQAHFIDGSPEYDYTSHRVSCSATLIVYGVASVIFSSLTTSYDGEVPFELVPVNSDVTPYAKAIMPKSGDAFKTVEISLLVIGSESDARGIAASLGADETIEYIPATLPGKITPVPSSQYTTSSLPGLGAVGGGWLRGFPRQRSNPVERGGGQSGEPSVIATDFTLTIPYAYVVQATPGNGSPLPTAPFSGSGSSGGGAFPTGNAIGGDL